MKFRLAAVLITALLTLPLFANDIEVAPNPGITTVPGHPTASYGISISTPAPGNLFLAGQPIAFTAHITNPGKEAFAMVTLRLLAEFGSVVQEDVARRKLPENGGVDQVMTVKEFEHLPKGSYRIECEVIGDNIFGYGTTLLGVWRGPAADLCDSVGISYAGRLNEARISTDLDLFHQAGVGWLRFPMKGWLPNGQAISPEAEQYKDIIQQASDRGFNLLAAFTPLVRDDPGVNPVQADKDCRESLLAAVTHYGVKIKYWELLRTKPDPNYPELRGIGFRQLVPAREALHKFDKITKGAKVIYSIEDPFPVNSLELFMSTKLDNGDGVGMRYNFLGIPEYPATPASPIESIGDVVKNAAERIRHTPPLWITEYGFDPAKGRRFPKPMYLAALVSRTLLLNQARGFAHTFWRDDPHTTFEDAFVGADGSVMPSLLALRTTLEMLQNVTTVAAIPVPIDLRASPSESKVWAFLLTYGKTTKHNKPKSGTHFALAIWSEKDTRALTLRTPATVLTERDLWGNEMELRPYSNTAVITVDPMPRFIDLGETNIVELLDPFAKFTPPVLMLRPGGGNKMNLFIANDPRCFTGSLAIQLQFRRWPNPTTVYEQKITLDPGGSQTLQTSLTIPDNAHRGQLYNINVSMLVGTRVMGYLTQPVYYDPSASPEMPSPLLGL